MENSEMNTTGQKVAQEVQNQSQTGTPVFQIPPKKEISLEVFGLKVFSLTGVKDTSILEIGEEIRRNLEFFKSFLGF